MTAVAVHQLHAGDVGVAVPDVDHIPKGDADILRLEVFVHSRVVDVKHALGDTKQELRLVGVVDHLRRPYRNAPLVVEKGAGVYPLKGTRTGGGGSLDHLFQPRGDDIVLHDHAVFLTVSAYAPEPVLDPGKEGNF